MSIKDLSPKDPVHVITLANDHVFPEKQMMHMRTCKMTNKTRQISKEKLLERLVKSIATTVKALDQ